MNSIAFELNGKARTASVDARTLLVDWLRQEPGLTGTHVGCDTSQCGACTVLLDGRSVKSCAVLAVQVDGHSVTTIEGLAHGPELHALQEAFMACHGLQCGFCTPGMIMTAACLLHAVPHPSRQDIVEAIDGNLCRCTGYVNIVAAIERAAQTLASAEGQA